MRCHSPIPRHRAGRRSPALTMLASGFRRFRQRWYGDGEELFRALRHGQNPHALLIACSDSRVDPVLLTDSRPGDLFVVRNVANLVPPCSRDGGNHGVSAAIEYAVKHLEVRDIIVMGHACCGGIRALVDEAGGGGHHGEPDEFIGPWVAIAREALRRVREAMPGASPEDTAHACELMSVRCSLEALRTFPWIRSREEEGTLALHGWYFDLRSGELLECDEESGLFHPLVGHAEARAGGRQAGA